MNCPKCDQYVGDYWTKGRKLQRRCKDCGWKEEPRTPEIGSVPWVKTVIVGQFGMWNYHVFDQYFQSAYYSRGFTDEAECRKEAQKTVNAYAKMDGYGKCTAVIWQPTIEVRGDVLVSITEPDNV